jgi:Tfp pilus assembly protein PilN
MAIKVNLLSREAQPKRAAAPVSLRPSSLSGFTMAVIGLWVVFAVALAWLGGGYALRRMEYSRLSVEVASLKEKDLQVKNKLVELDLAQKAKREIERRMEIIGKVAQSQQVPLTLMNGVVGAIPEGVWLSEFHMSPDRVEVDVPVERPAISYTNETLKALQEKREEVVAPKPGQKVETKKVKELRGFSFSVRGIAFNNFQVAALMDNLRKAGYEDVDFKLSEVRSVEQVRVMNFELTASVKLKSEKL